MKLLLFFFKPIRRLIKLLHVLVIAVFYALVVSGLLLGRARRDVKNAEPQNPTGPVISELIDWETVSNE